MAKVQVTTLLDTDLHFQMKRRGLQFTDAIRLGSIKMMQMEDGGDLVGVNANINLIKKDNEKMLKNISYLAGRVAAYKEQLEKMDAGILEKLDKKIDEKRAKEEKK